MSGETELSKPQGEPSGHAGPGSPSKLLPKALTSPLVWASFLEMDLGSPRFLSIARFSFQVVLSSADNRRCLEDGL